jgi:hypothetical protein
MKNNDNTSLLEIKHRKNTMILAIGSEIGVSCLLKVVTQRQAARISGNTFRLIITVDAHHTHQMKP